MTSGPSPWRYAYQGKMLRLARALVGEAMAEEVVQETWIAVLKALPGFEGRASLKTWNLSILSNIAKSRLRQKAHVALATNPWDEAPFTEEDGRFNAQGQWQSPPLPWHEETPEALLNAVQLRRCIENAIAALPPPQQAVLALRDIEGLAMDEICNVLDVSEGYCSIVPEQEYEQPLKITRRRDDAELPRGD